MIEDKLNFSSASLTFSKQNPKVLVVDDEESILMVLSSVLSKEGYQVVTAKNGREALGVLLSKSVDYIISDMAMPVLDGLGFLKEYKALGWEMPVIIMSAYGSVDSAVKATEAGAFDYIFKPFQPDEILLLLRKARERELLKKENLALRKIAAEKASQGLIYKSEAMAYVMSVVQKVAVVDNPVLITGESGTGKELIARAVHRLSVRKNESFVAINCGAIPENLLESELFGHIKGAFTDAIKDRDGLFKKADQGTLFLDEVIELPQSLQVKLLRAIQFKEFRPVGSENTVKVDVRIIAASGKDVSQEVSLGKFRDDLYYRLNVLPILLPPLRERRDDILLLIEHFLYVSASRMGRKRPEVSSLVLEFLINYNWPGNVRELENLIDRLLVMSGRDKLEVNDLPQYISEQNNIKEGKNSFKTTDNFWIPGENLDLREAILKLELTYIKEALKRFAGNRSEVSRQLGISYPNLLAKIKHFKL